VATNTLHKHTPHHANHESLWCPQCEDYGLVYCEHSDEDVWKCLYCGYQINLTKGTRKAGGINWRFPWEVLLAALLMSIFLYFTRDDLLRNRVPPNMSMPYQVPTWNSLR